MKTNKTITFFIFLFSFLMCTCDNESGNGTTAIARDYTLTLLGKTVTVTDTRTGAADKSLEELGVMEKLRGAVALLNESNNNGVYPTGIPFPSDTYNRVLAKGMIILFDEYVGSNTNTIRVKDDGKTIIIRIDLFIHPELYLTNPETWFPNGLAGNINLVIVDYLDKGLTL